MWQKFNNFMEKINWKMLAVFSIGFGLATMAYYPFSGLAIIVIWGVIFLMERKRLA